MEFIFVEYPEEKVFSAIQSITIIKYIQNIEHFINVDDVNQGI